MELKVLKIGGERVMIMCFEDFCKLKPCPFCGGTAQLMEDYSSELNVTRFNIWHECDGVKGESNGWGALYPWFETPWYRDKTTAINAWNRRCPESEVND